MGYNKITLGGSQICDYIYITNDENFDQNKFSSVESEPKQWDENTLLLAKFDGDLKAGDSELVGNLNGYELRRKKESDSHTEYVGTISTDYENKTIIDYMAANDTYYTYYLYPRLSMSSGGVTLSPSISQQVKPNWGYWSLLVVDESNEENVYYLNKMFKFELNLSTDDMSNNTVANVIQNFTEHPTVQYAPANYWSGGLTSLCGFISCNGTEYVEPRTIIKELKRLSTDSRKKFLKDMDGNVLEVKITSPINISRDDNTIQRAKTVKLSWTEVGDGSGVSVINNPDMPTTNWLLTEDGFVKPYVDYQWTNNGVWDSSRRWTGSDVLGIDTTNIGRDLYSEEG